MSPESLVSEEPPQRRTYQIKGGYRSGAGWKCTERKTYNDPRPAEVNGRWPANLLLCHLPGCRYTGTAEMNSSPGGHAYANPSPVSANGGFQEKKNRPRFSYAGDDGKETVDTWECIDGCPVKNLNAQSGILPSRGNRGPEIKNHTPGPVGFLHNKNEHENFVTSYAHCADHGGASRFFSNFQWDPEDVLYCPKITLEERQMGMPDGVRNTHPTIKPIRLMEWLVFLVTPPGGKVLDPFMGSGTTGMAALREGFRFLGLEQSAEYHTIARARVYHVTTLPKGLPITT
ncbi:MAG: site-specific DNA-methyltransferase, partial [Patescibacteria group bacterium]|nr:site-specific DNA-methyltransferase [Patescibacteria group bacterium]MDE2227405.1 site-specific DNA-methyltransferase [Patescibacteria group bacterium]